MKRDIHFLLQDDDDQSSTGAVLNVAPITDATTTFAPTSVDLAGYEGAEIIIATGARDQGTLTFTIKESDSDTSFSAVAAADMRGGTSTVTDVAGGSIHLRGYVGNKRYLKIAGAQTTASNGIPCSVIVLRTHARNKGKLSNV